MCNENDGNVGDRSGEFGQSAKGGGAEIGTRAHCQRMTNSARHIGQGWADHGAIVRRTVQKLIVNG